MRLSAKSREARLQWSRQAHAAKARKRLEGPPPDYLPRPEPGLLLHRIRVESCGPEARSVEILVRQARRLNQVTVEVFGQQSKPHGMDWLMRHLRKKLVVRWMRER